MRFFSALLTCLYFCTACTSTESLENLQPTDLRMLLENDWAIVSFVKDDKDLTAEYEELIITFEEDFIVKILSETENYVGTWKLKKTKLPSDASEKSVLVIDLSDNLDAYQTSLLSNTWLISDYSGDHINLLFENPEQTELSLLTLKRN